MREKQSRAFPQVRLRKVFVACTGLRAYIRKCRAFSLGEGEFLAQRSVTGYFRRGGGSETN